MGALAAALALPAAAQAPPGGTGANGPAVAGATASAVTPDTARVTAAEAAEDLALARVLAGVRLTPAQMERLLPVLESAQKQLGEAEAAARAAVAVPQPRLQETRRALIAGQNPSNRAEGQIAEQARIHGGKIRQLRADLVSSLRRTLSTTLSAEQQTALGTTARSLDVRERSARFMARAMAGGRGGERAGERGPIGWMGRSLDRARGASDANYPQERMEIAMRLARMGPGGGGRDGGRREPAAVPDAQMQRRLGPILALIDRTRQMNDAQYQSGRADLAMQIWSKRAEMGDLEVDPAETSEAIDELLDRYFLSPRMVGAMRARMERR
jgi:hypothetical protein